MAWAFHWPPGRHCYVPYEHLSWIADRECQWLASAQCTHDRLGCYPLLRQSSHWQANVVWGGCRYFSLGDVDHRRSFGYHSRTPVLGGKRRLPTVGCFVAAARSVGLGTFLLWSTVSHAMLRLVPCMETVAISASRRVGQSHRSGCECTKPNAYHAGT